MLREDIEQYTKLTGKDGWSVPIIKIGAYLDGYNKGLEVLEKIKAEIEAKCCITVGRECDGAITLHDVFEIIDKYKAGSEGE